jgi:hypothetical protein
LKFLRDHATCFKVTRALYGTIDAPRLWNDELANTLTSFGYKRAQTDWNIFYKKDSTGTVSLIAFHVDDGIIAASSKSLLNEIIEKLKN